MVRIKFLKAIAQRASKKTNWLAHYDRNLFSKPLAAPRLRGANYGRGLGRSRPPEALG